MLDMLIQWISNQNQIETMHFNNIGVPHKLPIHSVKMSFLYLHLQYRHNI